jgi:hypothetical protein
MRPALSQNLTDEPQVVLEPADPQPRDGDGPLQGVVGLGLGAQLVAKGGEEAVGGGNDLGSCGRVGRLGGSVGWLVG